ncbi:MULTISPECIES: hypothetical protein [unclassified Kitasatospora]|uniref:hypothetical protein n=1 Tax=unclassified Kitasatospora TaxID=2633591 RepID=UPI001ADF980C|nr:hypothetical protein [Kitasatospora sp. RG8]MBP0455410.1 hypothetical protein [Kitasatospora sp. RG8]
MLATRVSKFVALALIAFGAVTAQAASADFSKNASHESAAVQITTNNDRDDDVTWG